VDESSTGGGFGVGRSREIDILYLDTNVEIGIEIEAYGLIQGETYSLGGGPGGVPLALSTWEIGTMNQAEAEAESGELIIDLLSDTAFIGSFSGMFNGSTISGGFNVSLLSSFP
jgi:hypothetical protein